jgi:CHAT domain-containing protein/pimeloyl-ACP methyl ester carboxylesterase
MTVKLAISGQRDEGDQRATRGGPPGAEVPVTDLFDGVEVVASFDLSPSARTRAESAAPVEETVEDDDVLEIEVEGGFQIWTSAKRYREDVLLLKPGAQVGDAVSVDTLPRVSERGITEWLTSRLRVLRIRKDTVADLVSNPSLWPIDLTELAKDLGIDLAVKLPAWFATKVLIRIIEGRLKPGPGLYTWEDATRQPDADTPTPVTFEGLTVDEPILVFIHGTASSARGSFGAFLSQDAQPQRQALRQLFGDRIYAFEHRTLSDSPIDNAIALLQALPRNARVSIVSHSRGGLIGDLVSLTSISTDLLARFDRKDPQLLQADAHDRRQLERLAELIAEKQLRIERFVRCASPSRGTLLAGENIDIFLSVLTNLVGLIPGVGGTPLYEVTKRIALEIIRSRTAPTLVPGLEAMIPQSPLVALLNNLTAPAAGALGVIAGDIESGHWLKRLGVFASDHIIYEARDNDLVVNTDAMFHGARHDPAGYVFDKGGDVSHFNYFRNPRTRVALVDWLAGSTEEWPDNFQEIAADDFDPVPMLRSMQTRSSADQPIVFVLPGIMGSHLNIGDREVWMRYLALLRGGLGDLADMNAPNVRPVALVGDGYRELCEFLQDSHEVIPFAYDWRRSVADAAQLLGVEVENALRRTRQPVRIVAHSMGGLVVRAMIAAQPDLWDRMCARDGARLVMLGTPNRGSHDIVEALLGTSATVQQLALLDLAHDKADIAAIVAKFPGALELLPDSGQYFESSQWRRYRDVRRESAVPDDAVLAAARQKRDDLAAQLTLFPHADCVQYVAGASPRTVAGIEIINGRVVLDCTTEGDGRVTYESGRLPGVRTWYMDAVHGDLAAHEPAFRALQEVLETGTTTFLSTTPSSTARGGAVTYRALPEPVLYPTESSLAAGILGGTPRRPYEQKQKTGFKVSVVHGDLRYAKYPIVVGHYEGDTIIGAEKQVDELMRGALSQRYALGLYPGEFGSLAVVLRQPTAVQKALHLPSGAIVIGLGKWGELSTGQLSDLLRRATLQYVLELRDGLDASSDDELTARRGLSLLLIGGNSTTNIAIGDSVGAILRAIAQANRELADGGDSALTIQEIEVIELYTDTAIEAAHAAKRLAPMIGKELDMTIDAAQLLVSGREGRRRLTPTTGRDAWRRWEVSVVTPARKYEPPSLPKPLADRLKRAVLESANADAELLAALAELAIGEPPQSNEPHREIKFLTLSDRARAEATSQQRQPELVDRLIKDSISQPRFRHEESRVLFELTVPNELKSGLAQVDNLVLVLDAECATYPWELMSPGDKPLCITKALVRQLQTSNYRPQIGARAGTAAYVVGDPRVGPPYRQLSGAAAEARAVYDQLRNRFDVDEPITQPTALDVLAGLFKKPYRIVHLAGHGHYEPPTTPDGKARSGMVLDNGVFLTAVEVGQMQQVPELVFLNCCHIGQTGAEAVPTKPAVEFNRLAASVSRELIEMGVRAVIAAGWAVKDDAAKDFATVFYEKMLGGETFGRALRAARTHTYDMFGDCNTWGAYQAYGDPDYRLDPNGTGTAAAGLGPVDVAEFIEAISGIGVDAEPGSKQTPGPAVQNLNALVRDCPTDWLALTDVQMAIGYAYGKLNQYDTARRYLETALAGEGDKSTTTMRAVEELANYETRLADDVAKGDPERARELYDRATARLDQLLAVAETAERHNLIGAALKRRALAEPNLRTARKRLTEASNHYRQAHLLCLQRHGLDPYPTLNWVALATVLDAEVPDVDALLERCEATATEQFLIDRKFFPAIAIAEVALLRALRNGRLGKEGQAGDDELARLKDLYQETIRKAAPTARELTSVGKQITVTGRSLEKLSPNRATTKATVARLAELRRSIAGKARDERGTNTAVSSNGSGTRPAVASNGQPRRPVGEGISS